MIHSTSILIDIIFGVLLYDNTSTVLHIYILCNMCDTITSHLSDCVPPQYIIHTKVSNLYPIHPRVTLLMPMSTLTIHIHPTCFTHYPPQRETPQSQLEHSSQISYVRKCQKHIWVSFCRAGKIAVSCHFFCLRRAFVWPNHAK